MNGNGPHDCCCNLAGDEIWDHGPYVNVDACNDGGYDCSPYYDKCVTANINNGQCDLENYSEECNWDEIECDECAILAGAGDADLSIVLGNVVCDEAYNISECNYTYDGRDCF